MVELKVTIEKLALLELKAQYEEVIHAHKDNFQFTKDTLKSFITGFEACHDHVKVLFYDMLAITKKLLLGWKIDDPEPDLEDDDEEAMSM